NPIPERLLPEGAIIVKPSDDDPVRGLKYSVPYFTDYKRWIEEYENNTGAKFILHTPKQMIPKHLEMQQTYHCDRTSAKRAGCKGQVSITIPVDQDRDIDTWIMHIEIVGHTKHPRDSSNDDCKVFSNDVRSFITDRIRHGLNIEGVSTLFKRRAKDLKVFRDALDEKSPIHYQGVWESLVKVKDIYDVWKDVVHSYQALDKGKKKAGRRTRPVASRHKAKASIDIEEDDRVRRERARELKGITKMSEGKWSVVSSKNNDLYEVKNKRQDGILDHFTCTCKDYKRRKKPCKHVHAVTMCWDRQWEQGNTVKPEIIDITEDDAATVEPEIIDLTNDDVTVGLSEADMSMSSAISSMFDHSEVDISMVSTWKTEIELTEDDIDGVSEIEDLAKGVGAQLTNRGTEERLARIRSQLDGIRKILERAAVSSAQMHLNDQDDQKRTIKRRKTSSTTSASYRSEHNL
ncbi:hypothetical protein BGZ65_010532, partial [Modicella reniformis]